MSKKNTPSAIGNFTTTAFITALLSITPAKIVEEQELELDHHNIDTPTSAIYGQEHNISSTWHNYIELKHYSPEDIEQISAVLDTIWSDTDASAVIRKAFKDNGNNHIVIHSPNLSIEMPYNGVSQEVDLSTGLMTFTTPGSFSLSFELADKFHYDEDNNPVLASKGSMLYHELYHLAYENEDLLHDLKKHFLPSNEKEFNFDSLADFDQHIAERLDNDLRQIKNEISDKPLSQAHVYKLHYWFTLTREEHDQINEQLRSGETITLNDIEKKTGPLVWHELIRFTHESITLSEANPAFKLDIDEEELGKNLEILDQHFVAYNLAMVAHEKRTVDIVDLNYRAERNEPLRVDYNNKAPSPLQDEVEVFNNYESALEQLGL